MQNLTTPSYRIQLVHEQTITYSAIRTKDQAASVAKAVLEGRDREAFLCIMLDARNRPIGVNTVSVGSLTASLVHPREAYKAAILANVHSVIFAHNHPSANAEPSREDIQLTTRLVEAGRILGIRVLDHIIIGGAEIYSFEGEGKLCGANT